jgi:hypothetical protein
MKPRSHPRGPGFLLAGLPQRGQRALERRVRIRDDRGAQPRDAETEVFLENPEHFVDSDSLFAEPRASVAIDLQIEEPRRDERPVVGVAFRPRRFNGSDPFALDCDPDRLAVFIAAAVER